MPERNRITSTLLILSLIAGMALACEEDGQDPHPLDALRFATDIALGGSNGEVLYVVGSNFDRRYGGGVLQAIDLAALNAAVDAAASGAPPLFIEEVPWIGGVHIESFGGHIARAVFDDGTERLFVPLRGSGSLAVVDVSENGELSCYPDGGLDCRPQALNLPTPNGVGMADPFAAAVVGREVFVAALRTQATDEAAADGGSRTAFLARASVEAPEDVLVRPIGSMVTRDLVAGPDALQLFLVGARTPVTGGTPSGEIRSFPAVSFDDEELRVEARSLTQVVGSSDGRSLLFSADGARAYALTRSPSALIVFEADNGAGAGSFVTRSTIPMPDSPSRMAIVEQEGVRLGIVTATRDDALAIVDLDREQVVAVLDGTICEDLEAPCPEGARLQEARDVSTDVGVQPWGVVTVPMMAGGARIWVGSFAEGRLRAVDVPDLRRPWRARVTAVVGTAEGQ